MDSPTRAVKRRGGYRSVAAGIEAAAVPRAANSLILYSDYREPAVPNSVGGRYAGNCMR